MKIIGSSRDTNDPKRTIKLHFDEEVSDMMKTAISSFVGGAVYRGELQEIVELHSTKEE